MTTDIPAVREGKRLKLRGDNCAPFVRHLGNRNPLETGHGVAAAEPQTKAIVKPGPAPLRG